MAEQGWMTAAEIAGELGATEYSVNRAISALRIQGKKDITDRRRLIYPPGSVDKVKVWLESN
ncbi:MAG: hypothetical protein H0U76_19530 [Ktedonobacteraceae bacterium]|nr:hypothetical protein [Ktedonobacteraceae bacterium]MBA3826222.1 hypothetical protein [Ktedonobacterales bacterium]